MGFRSYKHKLFVKCILIYHANLIEFLIHSLELLRNSTIYWDNPRKCAENLKIQVIWFVYVSQKQ